MLFDTHIHTQYSTDSRMKIEDAVKEGKKQQLGLVITEHMDLDYPRPEAFVFDVNRYFQEYEQYRGDSVLLGIELGMRPHVGEANRQIIAGHPFDYVIGSIHLVDGLDIYYEEFYRNRSKQEAYNRYFDSMLECLKLHDFIDSLGHIDYIARYARYQDPEVYFRDFAERIDQILTVLVERQKAIEINTRRFDRQQVVESLLPIYKRFGELGGRWATIGSDAHDAAGIGKEIAAAREIAERCNLKTVYYKQRVPIEQ
ncbi:histidinol phosphate phosphatase hisj [Lucifera butyrica]|uniref:Histidinol-phosphatase n=1 Tax=Lucifera butyrica TaxID=1351585 RepID=A0A498RE21_9FIRM|nr:histidinol phosphate phosphatase [Lucifera butyrica]VBB07438.1 histidinol phosphate phosphatase hisj [Lucifera butyrica]